jgi:hypothetical protein
MWLGGVVVLLVIVVYNANSFMYHSFHIPIGINDVYAETGDIIMFKNNLFDTYNGPVSSNIAMMMLKLYNGLHVYYTHTGVVLRINDKPYILHIDGSVDYDHYFDAVVNSAPRITPLEDFKRDLVYIYKPKSQVFASNHDIDRIMHKIKHKKYELNIIKNLRCGFLKLNTHDDYTYVCTDLVEEVLMDLGVVDTRSLNANLYDTIKLIRSKYHYRPYLITA